MSINEEDDGVCRRLALQIASQLPDDRELALQSLEYAKQLVEFTHGAPIQTRAAATVTPLKPVG